MTFVRPKLATKLPPAPQLTASDFARLHQEARAAREALDVHAAKVERLTDEDMRIRVR